MVQMQINMKMHSTYVCTAHLIYSQESTQANIPSVYKRLLFPLGEKLLLCLLNRNLSFPVYVRSLKTEVLEIFSIASLLSLSLFFNKRMRQWTEKLPGGYVLHRTS